MPYNRIIDKNSKLDPVRILDNQIPLQGENRGVEKMSAFLGPIHHWMYNKIQIQQDIVDEAVKISKGDIPELERELEKAFGPAERRNLADAIDHTNIHGWLQDHVSRVENKLAFTAKKLESLDPSYREQLRGIFRRKGRELSPKLAGANAKEAYKLMFDSLLDGMPCDHASSILEEGEDRMVWKRNACVHAPYWEANQADVAGYYEMRDSFMEGLITDTGFAYKKLDDVTASLSKEV